MICERCSNSVVQNASYISCAQANADNHLGFSDWIPQSYIPAMGWSQIGDGVICSSYGQGLAENWLSSGANTVSGNSGGGGGDGGDGGGNNSSDGILFSNPLVTDCKGPNLPFFISSQGMGPGIVGGQTLNPVNSIFYGNALLANNQVNHGKYDDSFAGYQCMRCREGDAQGEITTPMAYADAAQLGVPAGSYITCEQANSVNYEGTSNWAPYHTYFTSEPCGCSGDGDGGTLDDDGNTVINGDDGPQCYDNSPPTETTPVVDPRIITVSGTIEEIPTPRVNHITSLLSPTKANLFNKPESYIDVAGNTQYQTLITNFITAGASSHTIKAGGDTGTFYEVVLKDETNSKWYDFENKDFTAGSDFAQGVIGAQYFLIQSAPDVFDIDFPAVSVDTVYKIYYNTVSFPSTIYEPITTPTEVTNEWTINQLANKQTNINWGTSVSSVSVATDGNNGSTNGNFSVTSAAGGNLNNSVYNLTLTFFAPGSKTMRFIGSRINFYGPGIHNDVATIDDLETPAVGDTSVITAMNMTASYVNNGGSNGSTGTLTGTITYGQVPLHDQTFIFNPDNFFTLN